MFLYEVTSPLKYYLFNFLKKSLENFCVVLFVFSPIGQEIRSEDYDILVLRCIGCIEPHIVVMMASKTMVQLGFGVNMSP
jgi:hypothetical protein